MAEPSAEDDSKRSRGARDRHLVDESLRRIYANLLEDDVPVRFVELIRKLRDQGSV
jgi:hypothetical protein